MEFSGKPLEIASFEFELEKLDDLWDSYLFINGFNVPFTEDVGLIFKKLAVPKAYDLKLYCDAPTPIEAYGLD